jgi:mannose-6-phosphate isomerase-like protein (cupin superfamily)
MEKVKELILIDLLSKSNADIKEYENHKKNWGKETWVINSENYCMKVLDVLKNRMCSIHYHRIKDETFFIVKGHLKLEIWGPNLDLVEFDKNKPDHIMTLWPGSSIHIPVKTAHRFTAIQDDAQFIEVSTHHIEEDSVRLIPSPPYGE